jgi:hypothetical protein
VLHGIHLIYEQTNGSVKLGDIELLSMYIAATIHDVDHPGVSNNFLIATSNPMSLLYNDKSVLENHHCSTAFTILQRTECNFLQHLEESEFRKFRSLVVDMVLATDLAQHFSLLTMFKKRILTPDSFEPAENREDKILYLQM